MTASAEDWGAHDLDRRFDLGPAARRADGAGRDARRAARADRRLAPPRAALRRRGRARAAHPARGAARRAPSSRSRDGPDADAEREEALRAVVAQAERLDATIDTLLAVARQELDPTDGAVDLAALAREFDDVEVTRRRPACRAPRASRSRPPRAGAARRQRAPPRPQRGSALELSAGDGRRPPRRPRRRPRASIPDSASASFEPGVARRRRRRRRGARPPARPPAGALVRRRRRAGAGPGGCFVLDLPRWSGSGRVRAQRVTPPGAPRQAPASRTKPAGLLPRVAHQGLEHERADEDHRDDPQGEDPASPPGSACGAPSCPRQTVDLQLADRASDSDEVEHRRVAARPLDAQALGRGRTRRTS